MITMDHVIDRWVNYLPRSVEDRYYSSGVARYCSPTIFESELIGVDFYKSLRGLDTLDREALRHEKTKIDGIYKAHRPLERNPMNGETFITPMSNIVVVAMDEYLFALIMRFPSMSRLIRNTDVDLGRTVNEEYLCFKLSMQLCKDVNAIKRESHKVFTDNVVEYAKRFDKLKK